MDAKISFLVSQLIEFRDQREWSQFHTLKNLACSLSIESAELLELVQWKSDAEVDELITNSKFKESLTDEVADVFLYLLLICDKMNIDILSAGQSKIVKNSERYPIKISRGNAIKQP